MKTSNYSVKGGFEIKEMDSTKREVVVYLAKFDNMDSDFDVIRKGAFAKSLLEHGVNSSSNRKIAFLRHHNWEMQIGKFMALEEDNYGLLGRAQLGRSTMGEDAWRDYEDGIIREHSIGFQYVKDKTKWIDDATSPLGGYYDITEVKLFEGSAVTFGANEMTNVVEVIKSQSRESISEQLTQSINTCVKALVNGKGSDERLFELEMKLKYLTGQLSLLASLEPIVKGHSQTDEPNEEGKKEADFNWDLVVKSLNY
jgi:HK97 family phage prohead protease